MSLFLAGFAVGALCSAFIKWTLQLVLELHEEPADSVVMSQRAYDQLVAAHPDFV